MKDYQVYDAEEETDRPRGGEQQEIGVRGVTWKGALASSVVSLPSRSRQKERARLAALAVHGKRQRQRRGGERVTFETDARVLFGGKGRRGRLLEEGFTATGSNHAVVCRMLEESGPNVSMCCVSLSLEWSRDGRSDI